MKRAIVSLVRQRALARSINSAKVRDSSNEFRVDYVLFLKSILAVAML
jgi:hypothetical protein